MGARVHLVPSACERLLLLLGVVGTRDFPVLPELLDRPRVRPELEPASVFENEHALVNDARHRRLSLPEVRVVDPGSSSGKDSRLFDLTSTRGGPSREGWISIRMPDGSGHNSVASYSAFSPRLYANRSTE